MWSSAPTAELWVLRLPGGVGKPEKRAGTVSGPYGKFSRLYLMLRLSRHPHYTPYGPPPTAAHSSIFILAPNQRARVPVGAGHLAGPFPDFLRMSG